MKERVVVEHKELRKRIKRVCDLLGHSVYQETGIRIVLFVSVRSEKKPGGQNEKFQGGGGALERK